MLKRYKKLFLIYSHDSPAPGLDPIYLVDDEDIAKEMVKEFGWRDYGEFRFENSRWIWED